MKFAVVGTGKVGQAIGAGLARASRDVVFGAREPGSDSAVQAEALGIPVIEWKQAVGECDAVVVTLPAGAVAEFIAATNPAGKLIVDATNTIRPVGETAFDLLCAVPGTRVVKAFNSTGYENMVNPRFQEVRADMFMAGDDPEAKAMVRSMALDLGFGECYDLGDGATAPLLEKFALLWITLSRGALGRDFAFKVLRRE